MHSDSQEKIILTLQQKRLIEAVDSLNCEALKKEIQAGVDDLDFPVNRSGTTLLELVIGKSEYPNSDRVFDLLIANGVDVNRKRGDRTFLRPLLYAVESDCSYHMVEQLIKHGADVNAQDNSTPLLSAVRKSMNHGEHKLGFGSAIAALLLENGADPTLPGLYDGRTPLDMCAPQGTFLRNLIEAYCSKKQQSQAPDVASTFASRVASPSR